MNDLRPLTIRLSAADSQRLQRFEARLRKWSPHLRSWVKASKAEIIRVALAALEAGLPPGALNGVTSEQVLVMLNEAGSEIASWQEAQSADAYQAMEREGRNIPSQEEKALLVRDAAPLRVGALVRLRGRVFQSPDRFIGQQGLVVEMPRGKKRGPRVRFDSGDETVEVHLFDLCIVDFVYDSTRDE